MPLTAFTIRLDRINKSLLYQDKAGHWWLSWICALECDDHGRNIVAQSIPNERYAAGEKGPQLGHWREIGSPAKAPDQQAAKRFDLSKSKFKNAAAPPGPAAPNQYPPGREGFFSSPGGDQSADLSREDGARLLINLAGTRKPREQRSVNASAKEGNPEHYDAVKDQGKARLRNSWPTFETPTRSEIEKIATLRGFSPEGVALAAARELLFCASSREGRVLERT